VIISEEAMKKISVIIITKNEEENIKECLDSVSWADEIILVDDESNDNTVKIASEYPNVKIFIKKMKGFGEQKNYALSKASNEWVLSIDADERVTEELKNEIIEEINKGNFDGYLLRRKNFIFGEAWLEDRPTTLRVFKRLKGRFSESFVHERVILDGSVGELKNPLLHYSRALNKVENYITTCLNHYTTKTAMDFEKKGVKINKFNIVYYFLIKPILIFFYKYIICKYFSKGVIGLILAQFVAIAYLISYIKLWERQNK